MTDELNHEAKLTVNRHVKSFMHALGLHAAVNTTGISENRAAFLEAERRVETAVRQAFSDRPVVEALMAYDSLIVKTKAIVEGKGPSTSHADGLISPGTNDISR